MYRFISSVLLIYALTLSYSFSQTNGSLRGTVIDGVNSRPLGFATVNVLNPDSSIVSGFVTQDDGIFLIENLKAGIYLIRISFLGYETIFIPDIRIKTTEQTSLNEVKLQPKGITKNEVVITAEKNIITSNAEKKVFNVDPSLNPGASAAEVLQQLPSVTSDQDGNISLRGEGSVLILIDGKPSALSGNGGNLLQQINASSIEKIEVITNPSSRYDADGSNGVINIILKKNTRQGANCLMNISYGSWNKNTSGISANYRGKKSNFFINGNYRYIPVFTLGDIEREYRLDKNPFEYDQTLDGYNYPHNLSFRGGADFNFNETHALSMSSSLGYNPTLINETYTYMVSDSSKIILNNTLFNRINNPASNFEHTISYRWTNPRSGSVVNIAGAWSRNQDKRDIDGWRYDLDPYHTLIDSSLVRLNSIFKNRNDIIVAQADYEESIFKTWKLESGLKATLRFIDNSYYGDKTKEQILAVDTNNNAIEYRDQIYAIYGMLSGNVGKTSIRAGLRAEQAYRNFTVTRMDLPFTNQRLNLFPSLFVTHKLTKYINASVSYSKRINRPSVQTLNPFPDNNDPNNQIIGNPYINPEIIHALELGGQWNSSNSTLTLTLYMRQTLDKIQRIRVTEGLISTIQFLNLNSAMNTGAEAIWRYDWAKWMNTTLSGNAYSIYLNSENIGDAINTRGWTCTGKLLCIIKPTKFFDIQINSNYNAPFITPQGKIRAIYYTDLSVKKDILRKRGSLTLGILDVMDTRQFGINTLYQNITQDVIRKRESRILNVGFNYRFGKNENTAQRKKNITDEFGGGGD